MYTSQPPASAVFDGAMPAYVHVGDGGAPLGWALFSVERFFATPFVSGVAVMRVGDDTTSTPRWACTAEAFATHKRSTPSPAKLHVACVAALGHGF